MHENEGLETYQVRKNLIELENHLGKRFGERERESEQRGEKTFLSRERSRKMRRESGRTYLQNLSKSQQMQVSRCVEVGVKIQAVNRCKCRAYVEEQTTRYKNRNSIDQPSYREVRNFLDRSTRCQEAIEIAIRKSLRSSIDSQVSRRCRGAIELAFKNSFLTREKHIHECNQTCNSTNDPINILSSQNHLSTIILSIWILKTHTHTKQV